MKYLVRWDEDENGKRTYQYSSDKQHKNTEKRYGWTAKCTKCGIGSKNGGKTLRQSNDIFNALETYHNSQCDNNLIITRSYHATEISHISAEQTTLQTRTGATTFADVSGAVLSNTSFTAGNKYLILTTAQVGGTSTSVVFGWKLIHGATDFADSVVAREVSAILVSNQWAYSYFTVWTAVGSEDVKMQHKTTNTGQTVRTDTISMIAIDLDDNLTENVDWHFDSNSTPTALDATPTFSTTNNASITIDASDHSALADYMVLASGRFDIASVSNGVLSRIDRTGEVVESTYHVQEDGENLTDFFIQFNARVFNLGNASNTFTQTSAERIAGSEQRTHSSIFALNLTKFKSSSSVFVATSPPHTTFTPFGNQVATTTYVPAVTGDAFILGYAISTLSITNDCQWRLQMNDVDQPAGQSDYTEGTQDWLSVDRHTFAMSSVENLTIGSFNTFDLDASYANLSGSPSSHDVSIMIFSFEFEKSFDVTNSGMFDVAIFGDPTQFDTATDWVVGLTDGVGSSDIVTAMPFYNRFVNETVVIMDLAERAWHNTRAIVEPAITIGADMVEVVQGLLRNIVEIIPVSDIINRAGSTYNRFLTETVPILDIITKTLSNIRALSETVAVSDLVGGIRGLLKTIAEPAVLIGADVVGVIKVNVRNLAEIITNSDVVSRSHDAFRTLTESEVINDVISITKTVSATIVETAVTVGDGISRLLTLFRGLTESETVGDNVTRNTVIDRIISETSVVIGDGVARLLTLFRSISEPLISITDSVVFNSFLQLVLRFPTRIKDILSFGTRIKEDLNFTTRINDVEDNTI